MGRVAAAGLGSHASASSVGGFESLSTRRSVAEARAAQMQPELQTSFTHAV